MTHKQHIIETLMNVDTKIFNQESLNYVIKSLPDDDNGNIEDVFPHHTFMPYKGINGDKVTFNHTSANIFDACNISRESLDHFFNTVTSVLDDNVKYRTISQKVEGLLENLSPQDIVILLCSKTMNIREGGTTVIGVGDPFEELLSSSMLRPTSAMGDPGPRVRGLLKMLAEDIKKSKEEEEKKKDIKKSWKDFFKSWFK